MGNSDETKKLILELAKKEFLQKGFKSASVRNIAKTGNITTGAIYRYFPNNESLFMALVEPAATEVFNMYKKTQQNFLESSTAEERSSIIDSDDNEALMQMLDRIYNDIDAFKLIICHSEGTKYADYIDKLTNIAVQNTYRFIEVLREDGQHVADISDYAVRTFCHGNMIAIFDVIVQDIPKRAASDYINEIFTFYNEGWKKILNL